MGITEQDAIKNPQWCFIRKECTLVRGLIGSGITELGKASYRDGEWHYYNAFFSLSIGIERLAKLILLADGIITNEGALPKKKTVTGQGHNLGKLLCEVDKISTRHTTNLIYPCQFNDISKAIIYCLNSFANAKQGRYFNIEALWDKNTSNKIEPIEQWWQKIAEPILDAHYYNKDVEQGAKNYTSLVLDRMQAYHSLFYLDETRKEIKNPRDALIRMHKTEIVQKVSCFYTLTIMRWMAEVFIKLYDSPPNAPKFEMLYGHSKYFVGFIQSDEHLKITKHWPVEIQH